MKSYVVTHTAYMNAFSAPRILHAVVFNQNSMNSLYKIITLCRSSRVCADHVFSNCGHEVHSYRGQIHFVTLSTYGVMMM
jgi:hypothetical protein